MKLKPNKLVKNSAAIVCAAFSISSLNAQVFVIGDGFATNSSGSFDLSMGNGNGSFSGTGGIAGNTVESVYRVSDGVGGNPFAGGNAGGTFSPLAGGTFFGTDGVDYRTMIEFDLSGHDLSAISTPPAGQEYVITSIELFLELSSPDEISGGSVDLDVYSNIGVTLGAKAQTPDATFTAIPSGNNSNVATSQFLPPILLSDDAINLGNQNNFFVTLDVAENENGIRFGSSLSTADDPNFGINGTGFVEVAPRLRITTELTEAIPEPSTFALLSLGSLGVL